MAQPLDRAAVRALFDEFMDARPQAIRGLGDAPTLSSTDEEKFLAWRESFEGTAPLRNWTVENQKQIARQMLTGDARASIEDIDIQAANNNFTLANLLDAYEARFLAGAGTELAIAKFNSCKQRPEETPRAWASRATKLYRRAYPNAQNPQEQVDLLRRIRSCLYNQATVEAISTHAANNVAELVALINRREANLSQQAEMARTMGGGGLNAIGGNAESHASSARRLVAAFTKKDNGEAEASLNLSPGEKETGAAWQVVALNAIGSSLSKENKCYICGLDGHKMNSCRHRDNLTMVRQCAEKLAQRVANLARQNRSKFKSYQGNGNSNYRGRGNGRGGQRGRGRGNSHNKNSSSSSKGHVQSVGDDDDDEDDHHCHHGGKKSYDC